VGGNWSAELEGLLFKSLLLAALLASHGVAPSVVTFTGNSTADFANVDTFTLIDAKDIAVNSGFDIRAVKFHYDIGSDTAYFGK
jgi:hypothetical protein